MWFAGGLGVGSDKVVVRSLRLEHRHVAVLVGTALAADVCLGPCSSSRSFKYSRWIPECSFPVSLTAAILIRFLLLFEQQGEALIWLRLVETGALYVALVRFLDVLWLVLARLGRRRVAPPRFSRICCWLRLRC